MRIESWNMCVLFMSVEEHVLSSCFMSLSRRCVFARIESWNMCVLELFPPNERCDSVRVVCMCVCVCVRVCVWVGV